MYPYVTSDQFLISRSLLLLVANFPIFKVAEEAKPRSIDWVRGMVMHPTIQIRVLSNLNFGVYFFVS